MIFIGVFLLELGVLFLLIRALTMHLSVFLYRLGLSERMVMHILAAELSAVLLTIFGLAYPLGWRISLEQLDLSIPGSLVSIIKQADLYLGIPIILDMLIIGGLLILSRSRS